MSAKSKLEKVAEWITRIVLLPIGLFCLWAAINQLIIEEPMSSLEGGVQSLVLAGLFLYAAVYPAPPWRNEPLKTLLLVLICMVAVFVWWVGTIIAAILVVKHTVGENVPFHMLIVCVTTIVFLIVPFFLAYIIQSIYAKHRARLVK